MVNLLMSINRHFNSDRIAFFERFINFLAESHIMAFIVYASMICPDSGERYFYLCDADYSTRLIQGIWVTVSEIEDYRSDGVDVDPMLDAISSHMYELETGADSLYASQQPNPFIDERPLE